MYFQTEDFNKSSQIVSINRKHKWVLKLHANKIAEIKTRRTTEDSGRETL